MEQEVLVTMPAGQGKAKQKPDAGPDDLAESLPDVMRAALSICPNVSIHVLEDVVSDVMVRLMASLAPELPDTDRRMNKILAWMKAMAGQIRSAFDHAPKLAAEEMPPGALPSACSTARLDRTVHEIVRQFDMAVEKCDPKRLDAAARRFETELWGHVWESIGADRIPEDSLRVLRSQVNATVSEITRKVRRRIGQIARGDWPGTGSKPRRISRDVLKDRDQIIKIWICRAIKGFRKRRKGTRSAGPGDGGAVDFRPSALDKKIMEAQRSTSLDAPGDDGRPALASLVASPQPPPSAHRELSEELLKALQHMHGGTKSRRSRHFCRKDVIGALLDFCTSSAAAAGTFCSSLGALKENGRWHCSRELGRFLEGRFLSRYEPGEERERALSSLRHHVKAVIHDLVERLNRMSNQDSP